MHNDNDVIDVAMHNVGHVLTTCFDNDATAKQSPRPAARTTPRLTASPASNNSLFKVFSIQSEKKKKMTILVLERI